MDDSARIMDSDIDESNYSVFRRIQIIDDGLVLVFEYPSGDKYSVGLNQIMGWFEGFSPILNWKKSSNEDNRRLFIEKCDLSHGGHAAIVCLSNGNAYQIAWDTVLMACEPRYEWYGGLPDELKAIVKEANAEQDKNMNS